MAKRDINKSEFDAGTQLKLDIFRECYKEWFPVFTHNPYINEIHVFDLFAGSGTDSEGGYGSPLILLDESKGKDNHYCEIFQSNSKDIEFHFNELDTTKVKKLEENVDLYFKKCKETCTLTDCLYELSCTFQNRKFRDIFDDKDFISILKNNKFGKFILLDQYGYKQIDDEVFQRLIDYPKTDFIFFIASGFIQRFKSLPAVQNYFKDLSIKNLDESKPKECHRIIADYYRSLIPHDKEYYLHHFSYLKGTNHYGLIFGSNHTFGMEKFLNVCWRHDKYAGESTENIFGDYGPGTLFNQVETPTKIRDTKELIKRNILDRNIVNNKEGLKFALNKGCQPKIFVESIDELLNDKIIEVDENFNRSATSIHNVKIYNIKVL